MLVEGLKHNLISISQLCHKGFKVMFEPNNCLIYDAFGSFVLIEKRVNNIYLLDLHHASFSIHCLLTKEDDTWLWQRGLCHIHMQHFNRRNRKQLVEGLPKLKFEKIECVKHVKKENGPRSLLNKKMLFQLKDLQSCFTWIYFVHLEL